MENGLKCCDCGSSKREINLGTGRCIMCECYVKTKRADAAEAELARVKKSYQDAFEDGVEGRDWLQANLPAKYLGKNIINSAADWMRTIGHTEKTDV